MAYWTALISSDLCAYGAGQRGAEFRPVPGVSCSLRRIIGSPKVSLTTSDMDTFTRRTENQDFASVAVHKHLDNLGPDARK